MEDQEQPCPQQAHRYTHLASAVSSMYRLYCLECVLTDLAQQMCVALLLDTAVMATLICNSLTHPDSQDNVC